MDEKQKWDSPASALPQMRDEEEGSHGPICGPKMSESERTEQTPKPLYKAK
jgi:hypothetical protein